VNFTFKQCAELAELKESTARFYRDTFPNYFSSVGEGRKRQYYPSVVEVLKFISGSYAQNLTQEQIEQLLEMKWGVILEVKTQELNNAAQELRNTVTTQSQEHSISQSQLLEIVKTAFFQELEKRDEAILRLEKQVELLSQAQEQRDLELMKAIRSIQERNNETWLDRLLKPFRKQSPTA
jgi:DNA-binding transcriptional MerR regulator